MEMTLPKVTFTGLAERMGVAVGSLYKHVDGIDALRLLIAEEILARWEIPPVIEPTLEEHLLRVSGSLRRLAHDNPGVAQFLTHVSRRQSPDVVALINGHHERIADVYGIDPARCSWLVSTVAEHALAIADLVHTPSGRGRDHADMARDVELTALSSAARIPVERDQDALFDWSMRALIVGATQLIAELPVPAPVPAGEDAGEDARPADAEA